MKLLFTSRRPPASSHADSENTGNACACNWKAFLKNALIGPPAVWSASSGATENLNGNCEGTVSFPLSPSLVLNMCVYYCAQAPPINICSLGFITRMYYKAVLRVFSPNFLKRKAQVTVTIRVRHSSLYCSISWRFCRIKSALEAISESLKFQNFLREHAPTPP